jgi:hypothetical protein
MTDTKIIDMHILLDAIVRLCQHDGLDPETAQTIERIAKDSGYELSEYEASALYRE